MSQEYLEQDRCDELFQELAKEVQEAMQRLHVPGVAVGILEGDRECTAGFGVTSVENPLPVDADTLFQIGSITKTVTATAAMRLVEQGRLDLDAPVRTYLPGLRLADEETAAKVTLRHLFNHTGGWAGDYFDGSGPGDDALDCAVRQMVKLPQVAPLGRIYSYNNAGFYIAGRLVEIAAGMPYEAAVKELVLDPLGMTRSFYFADDAISYRVACGHDPIYDTPEQTPPSPVQLKVSRPWGLARAGYALGGLNSTIHDLLRYARFQVGDGRAPGGTRLLTKENLERMHTATARAANDDSVGISWFLTDLDGVENIHHGGATNGQQATFQAIPSRKFAVVFLTNSDRGEEIYKPLTRWVFEHYLGIPVKEPQPIPSSPSQLEAYVGCYQAVFSDRILELQGDLLVQKTVNKGGFPTPETPPSPNPPDVRMALCGEDRLVALDAPAKGECGEFFRNEAGKIIWFRYGGRVHVKKP